MKVLLLWPPMTVYFPDPKIPASSPPLGLAYIAALLEQHGYEVKIVDALAEGLKTIEKTKKWFRVGLTEKEIKKIVKDYQPQVVGISGAFTAYIKDSLRCAQLVKRVDPKVIVVFGGAHSSSNFKEVFKNKNVDFIVKGEGEQVFLDLIKTIEAKKNPKQVRGLIFRQGKGVKVNPPGRISQNLDQLPFPARHLLKMGIYFKRAEEFGEFLMRQPQGGIISSRGCPGNCVFCSIHSVWSYQWRARSPKNVVDEIEHLINQYGVREIAFLDDNMTLDKKRTIQICNEIIKRKLDIKWCTPNGVALSALDKPMIKKMKEAGCYRLTFGIESGDPEMQKFIGKIVPFKRTKSLIDYANNIGLWTAGTFIIGFPFEDEASIRNTIKYARECGIDYAVFYVLAPYPGTRVHEICKKSGLLSDIKPEDWGYILSGGGYQTKIFTPKELRRWQSKAQSQFLRSRFYSPTVVLKVLKKVRSTEDFLYTLKIAKTALRIMLLQRIKGGDVKSLMYKKYDKGVLSGT